MNPEEITAAKLNERRDFDFKERFKLNKKSSMKLLFLMAVSSSSLLTLVRGYLMSFSLFTTWHSAIF
ncbi:hypothetical protein LPB144_09240 [Christiangramia salexigens]|uniref:Uncharacterized protein n=1 Tax=Christiangramia salexigens TaxID=1913577 RepID=A0A1L3J633_9FLAO|nr:hypothetical protein LPB144_09240 [Christiangramia salexigens]